MATIKQYKRKDGSKLCKEEEADDDKKQTIVADTSQIGQGKLPQTGFSGTNSLILLGYVLLVMVVIAITGKKKHDKRVVKNRQESII